MNPTGYSGKPLIDKLGFAPGDSILLSSSPDWYAVFVADNALTSRLTTPTTHAHIFCSNLADLETFLATNKLTQVEKSIWFSWPKKSSGISTDITEQTFRDHILPLGWVDTKVAAIDETWSGLKFLRRKT